MTNIPTETSPIITPRPYDSRFFVEPEIDTGKIKQKIRETKSGKISRPIVNFWGVQGSGKTWLLKYLREHYQFDPTSPRIPREHPTFAVLYTFTESPDSSNLGQIVRALAADTLAQLPRDLLAHEDYEALAHITESGNVTAFGNVFNGLASSYLPIILLDNAEKISSEARGELEQQLIEPLAVNNRILIVLAGRRYMPRWQRFEVRKRVTEYSDTHVKAFDKETAQEQITRSDYHIPIEWIYPISGGNPYLTDVVANRMSTWAALEPLDQQHLEKHHADLIPLLKSYETNLLKGVSEQFLPVFYAVAFLRTFRLEALRFMLGEEDQASPQPVSYYVGLLHELDRETEVVWWSHEARAYVVDATVRRVINRRELLENPAGYLERHHQALAMYRQWAEKFPEVSEDFIKEIFFHLGSIYQADNNLPALADAVEAIIKLAEANLRPDGLFVLRNLCDEKNGDRELMELLPDQICQKIYQEFAPL